MTFPITVRDQETQPFLAVRLRTPAAELPAHLGESYGAIMAYMGQLGHQPSGMPFTAYYNADMKNLDVEIAIPTAEILPGQGDIYSSEIPAGKVAELIYTGPYTGMRPAYEQLESFVAQRGAEMAGPAYEIYIDDPGETPVENLRTIILFPIKEE